MQDFSKRIQNAGAIKGIENFFSVSVSGTCPVWSFNIWTFGTLRFDHLCGSLATKFLGLAAAVLLAISSLFAVRVALS